MDRSFIKAVILGLTMLGTSAVPALSQGLAGPYLAGSRAFDHGSFDAAARYFVRAMAADTTNLKLKRTAMVSFVAAGEFDAAAGIAELMRENSEADLYVDLVTIVKLASNKEYQAAFSINSQTEEQVSPILWMLLDAWLKIGAGEIEAGLVAFEQMSDNETFRIYGRYHKGLALAYLGKFDEAASIMAGDDNGPLHLNRDSIVVHIEVLSELGRGDEALRVLDVEIERGFRDEQLLALRANLANGDLPKFQSYEGPIYGIAEAFITIADALSQGEPDRTALFYARLAQFLRPEYVDASLAVAKLLELEEQYHMAGEAYGLVSEDSASFKDAEIGRAEALRAGGDTEGATEILKSLSQRFSSDVLVLNALGDIYRGVENFEDSIVAYTKAIENVGTFGPQHWVMYYTRGIGYERVKDWPAAEADFRRALELSPDQPFVLNYIAYSYIEMGINFEEAQAMIEKAVEGMPSNGYITDSLGWVLYRVGKFAEAVAPMERAVELLPIDPIVNDHLGDVLWAVGRKLEAEFQWKRAMSFDPAPEDLERIKRKLDVGLDVVLDEEATE